MRLQDECYYVGTTSAPRQRLQQHRAGVGGSEWTRIHPPISGFTELKKLNAKVTEVEARLEEDCQVKKLMHTHGINAVRGGSYTRTELDRTQVKSLSKELWHASNGCLRCGRSSHWAKDCYAQRDVSGNEIVSDEADEDEEEEEEEEEALVPPSRRRAAVLPPRPATQRSGAGRKRGRWWEDEEDDEEMDCDDFCFRCGRPGHWANQCYARRHANGRTLAP